MPQIASLPHRTLIRIAGPDWATFLKGLCTAHIDRISDDVASGRLNSLHYGAFLRPQGKMYADCLLILVAADEIWLDVPLSARDELLSRLNMYKLRAKVTIEPLERPVFVAFGDAVPENFSTDPRSAIVGAAFGFAYGDRMANTDAGEWMAYRMRLGISDPGYDFGADELYAIDANLDLLDAIDFHKGCYVGQELTSRMKRRGQIKNRILPVMSAQRLQSGTELTIGERKVGDVLAVTPEIAPPAALALVRLDRLSQMDVVVDQTKATLDPPTWLTANLSTVSE